MPRNSIVIYPTFLSTNQEQSKRNHLYLRIAALLWPPYQTAKLSLDFCRPNQIPKVTELHNYRTIKSK